MATDPAIGTRIRKRRQALSMTQEEFGRRVGVDRSTVGNWETGKHFPRRYLGKVEDVLGISHDEDDGRARIISPELRRLIIQTLDDAEDQRRVIGLLEGTLTWPAEPGEPGPGRQKSAG